MAANTFELDGALARAARHLCQVSVRTVAKRAGLDPDEVRSYEKGAAYLTPPQAQRLADALGYYGARFIADDGHGGAGVRRKFGRTKVSMIENWEGEGGPVAEDDV